MTALEGLAFFFVVIGLIPFIIQTPSAREEAMVKIYYWCDGTWCHEENLEEYGWMSDDTIAVEVSAAWTDDQIDSFVHSSI